MRFWKYEIYSRNDDSLLLSDGGFETEEDAELQADMEARCENIKNYYIRTMQEQECKF